ncbi:MULTISPECIES: aminoglycoside phosphotransferase family protein [Pseudarthrobacter]|uniref:Streptomycin 6-kinase n=1 Tax=Pseudarthrobacter niigatensis TaxID=369935 RepID=A0AAJ1SXD8_9MICC|nr:MULTISPECIES: aminoglycoside phosphotransferase family protein [Pseudarthrobacter]MDQ0146391.1 streptomycin 6-kinase [Pseudarthrobacter niigatensis]MDQ0264941.1 streptomycin 6-kinase [Pseudarthrobacter niigatensis]
MPRPVVPAVPIPPRLAARYARSSAGRDWLGGLPGLLADRLEQWHLEVDLEPGSFPWSGHGGLVVPVRQDDGSPAALKIAFPHDEAQVERHALALWGGRGAVLLLASDGASCAMLLERLEGGRSLAALPVDEAVHVWGGLVRELGLVPDHRPEWQEFSHIAARAEQWSDDLPADWDLLGRPFPRWLLEAALEVCQKRGAVGRRSAYDVLVHTDLHFDNVLARPGTAGATSAGYAAIDPQPMVGEAGFAVAPLLWNRLKDLPAALPGPALVERCQNFSAAAGLDPDAAREWAIAREVDNALWYFRNGHRGDLARSLWVASTLAGNTLAGLPHPHSLPEPGQDG